jgi:hypothetical protein
MSDQKLNPVRLFAGRVFYWTIWGPACAVAVPFVLLSDFVNWLSWDAFPWVGRAAQPIWGAVHAGTLRVGNRIAGVRRDLT